MTNRCSLPLFLALIALLACHRSAGDEEGGGATGGGPGAGAGGAKGGTAPAACGQLATARCERKMRCDPAGFRRYHQDLAECLATEGDECRYITTAPDSQVDAAWVAKCTDATAAGECPEAFFHFGDTPGCEEPPGKRKTDQACQDDVQCASSLCGVNSATARCGTCFAVVEEGGACGPADNCRYPLQCKDSRCARRPALGQPCDDVGSCRGGLACHDGTCRASVKDGESCEHWDDCQNRLSECLAGVCTAPRILEEGESCRGSGGGPIRCAFGLDCEEGTLVCVPGPKLGERCDSPGACSGRAWCYSDTCEVPSAAWCPIK